jgi:hypothetical protein
MGLQECATAGFIDDAVDSVLDAASILVVLVGR